MEGCVQQGVTRTGSYKSPRGTANGGWLQIRAWRSTSKCHRCRSDRRCIARISGGAKSIKFTKRCRGRSMWAWSLWRSTHAASRRCGRIIWNSWLWRSSPSHEIYKSFHMYHTRASTCIIHMRDVLYHIVSVVWKLDKWAERVFQVRNDSWLRCKIEKLRRSAL